MDKRLLTLALSARLDGLEKVKKAIDDMVSALKKEAQSEVEQKTFCTDEFNKNQLETEDRTRIKADFDSKMQAASSQLEKIKKEIEGLNGEVAEMGKQLQLAEQNREQENKEFQKLVTEQRSTQKLLKQALDVLGSFYNKAKLVQVGENPAAPAGFKEYKKAGGSHGVLGMIEQIMKDTAAMEAEAVRAENSAQSAYESFAKKTAEGIAAKQKELNDKAVDKAKAEGNFVQARESKEGTGRELKGLADSLKQLHDSCDFLLKNFDLREQSREEEMDSLKQAKAILSGAKFVQLD